MKMFLASSCLIVALMIVGCDDPSLPQVPANYAPTTNSASNDIAVVELGRHGGRHQIVKVKVDGSVYTIYRNYDSDNQSSLLLNVKPENASAD